MTSSPFDLAPHWIKLERENETTEELISHIWYDVSAGILLFI